MDQTVRVGVGVLLVKRDQGEAAPLVLVGKRKGSHGAGTYALPGGHLEFGESFAECAAREVLEETGIVLGQPAQFAYATNDIMPQENKHYVTVFVRADVDPGTEAQLLEPHKCEGWLWVPFDQIPKPHFEPLVSLLASPFTLQ